MASNHTTDDQAIDAWLEWLEGSKGRSKRTVEAYGLAVRRLREYLALDGVALLDVDAVQLEVFTGLHLHKAGVVARSRAPYVSALRGFFAFAHERRMVSRNPAAKLEQPKTGNPLPRTISLANAERLMWAPDMGTFIGIRDAAMLAILIGFPLNQAASIGVIGAIVFIASLRSIGSRGRAALNPLVAATEMAGADRSLTGNHSG